MLTSDDEGRTCYVTGWGLTANNGDVSTVLKEVKASIQEENICRTSWGSKMFNQEKECAGTLFGADSAANGESGGPLQCQLANGVWVQIGITSFGPKSQGFLLKKPNIYTKLFVYVPYNEKMTEINFP